MKKYTCLFVCVLISTFSFAQRASFDVNYYIGELNKTLQLSQDQQKTLRSMLSASELQQKSLKNDLEKLKVSGEENSEAATKIKKEIRAIKAMDEKKMVAILTDEQKTAHANRKVQRKYELQLEKMVEVMELADSQQAPVLALIIDYNTELDSVKRALNVALDVKKQKELVEADPPTPVAMEETSKKKKNAKEMPVVKIAKVETTTEDNSEQIKQLKISKRRIVDNYEDSLKVFLSPVQFDLYRRDKMLRPITGKLNQFQRKADISKEVGDKVKALLVNYNQRRNKLMELGKADASYTNLSGDLKSIKTSFDNQLSELLSPEQVELFNTVLKKYVK